MQTVFHNGTLFVHIITVGLPEVATIEFNSVADHGDQLIIAAAGVEDA